ncbi:secreted RxLR effector protein 161-like [Phragmites australis]|uniref:secreted RxLR effector protein 161-like n=1 Tax=Phragmites australis TaxID=29695 RepID=UPI002D7955D9|nr:secreted RxLR effector protein 161-like [Phragmites australis]
MPTVMHYKAVKQILRYLKGTVQYGIVYTKGGETEVIIDYTDSDLAGDMDDRKSNGGMTFYINDSLVSWNSQKHKTVALSFCEAEFMAATAAACQALWLRNPIFHGRSKHIDTKFHFIRECVEEGHIEVDFICTEEQRANALMKALPTVKLAVMRHLLGVCELDPRQD